MGVVDAGAAGVGRGRTRVGGLDRGAMGEIAPVAVIETVATEAIGIKQIATEVTIEKTTIEANIGVGGLIKAGGKVVKIRGKELR